MPLLIDPREDPMCLCKEFVNPKKGQGPRALQQNPQESASAPGCRNAERREVLPWVFGCSLRSARRRATASGS